MIVDMGSAKGKSSLERLRHSADRMIEVVDARMTDVRRQQSLASSKALAMLERHRSMAQEILVQVDQIQRDLAASPDGKVDMTRETLNLVEDFVMMSDMYDAPLADHDEIATEKMRMVH